MGINCSIRKGAPGVASSQQDPFTRQQWDAAIAATRFGVGARAGEIAAASRDPRGYLKAQIRASGAEVFATGGETTPQRLAAFRQYRQERAMAARDVAAKGGATNGEAADPVKAAQQFIRRKGPADVQARLQLGVATDAGFRERWALFWANHFTVSATKVQTATLVGPYENEAIRPNVFGRFADLLGAVETHPAMILYLDQAQSVGPGSRAAEFRRRGDGPPGPPGAPEQARRTAGLNENLAREILELHTVGIDGGYTQADVTEFARALTGLSIAGPRDPVQDQVVFREQTHEPGARSILGVRYPAGGAREQTGAILGDLAGKPQTARFLCAKIARHFVADQPPPALAARLEKTWTATGGDLARVAEALIDAPEAWAPTPAKFKTPYEFVLSSYRAVGGAPRGPQVNQALTSLGQRPFGAPSPKGWPDEAAPWAASDAIVKRMQFAQGLAAFVGPNVQDPMALARDTLGARLSPAAATAIGRAESRSEAVALLLMTPEFQRR